MKMREDGVVASSVIQMCHARPRDSIRREQVREELRHVAQLVRLQAVVWSTAS